MAREPTADGRRPGAMRTPAALLPTALLMILAIAGCGWEYPGVAISPSPAPSSASPAVATPPASAGPSGLVASPSDLLISVGYRGGHCRTGPCDRTVAIDRDGGVRVLLPQDQELGTLAPELFGELRKQLSVADFEQLGSRPFTGECPVNFDGQELIYTFHGSTGEIRLASCEVELDPAHPLFVAIENALASVPIP